MRYLFTNVGVGPGQEESILASVNSYKPDKVVFIVTEDSKSEAEKIKAKLENINIEMLELKTPEDFNSIYITILEKMKSIASEDAEKEFYCDITRGTKIMSDALLLAAFTVAPQDSYYVYVSGQRNKEGQVISGTIEVKTFNLWSVNREISKLIAIHFFNKHQYASAIEMLDKIKNKDDEAKELLRLCKIYYYWDILKYEIAFGEFRELNLGKLNISQKTKNKIIKNKNFLEKLVKETDNLKKRELRFADVINNAKRRMEEGKYDDAVGRLYRALEFLLQTRIGQLLKETNYSKEFEDIDKIDNATFIWLTKIVANREDYQEDRLAHLLHSNEIFLTVKNSIDILDIVNDDLGRKMKEDKVLNHLIQKRNKSVLAHGFENVSREECQKFLEKIIEYGKLVFKDFNERGLEDCEFPKITVI